MSDTKTDDRSVTDNELLKLREDNLRLRDLLISKDAELGSLRGQVAALEAGTARLLNLVGRIRSTVPGPLLWVLVKARGLARRG